jgi:transcriptional regulator with XRE-family HTH domain
MDNTDTFVGRLEYATRIREAELGAPIDDKGLAAKAGISPSAVSQWKKGSTNTTNLKAAPVFAVAKFLKVRPEWLWEKRGPMRDEVDDIPPEAQEFYADFKKAIGLGLTRPAVSSMRGALRTILEMGAQQPKLLDLNAPTPPDESDSTDRPQRT